MKYTVEFIGTFFLVAVVVGSGIMAENISNGNVGVALLGNTIATGAILFVLIKAEHLVLKFFLLNLII